MRSGDLMAHYVVVVAAAAAGTFAQATLMVVHVDHVEGDDDDGNVSFTTRCC